MSLLRKFFTLFRPDAVLPPKTVTPAPTPAPAPEPPTVPQPQPVAPQYRGSNLTGGDCLWSQFPSGGPVDGTNYMFVSEAQIDDAIAHGETAFRLLFGWEAMQPTPYFSLTSTISTNDAALRYFSKFKQRVDYITTIKKCTCLIDIHGGADSTFAAYYGAKIGTAYQGHNVSDLFENLWWQLAGIFKDNPRVWFGLTNEPHDMPASVWYPAAQRAIDGIRRNGATNKIACPGIGWSNASTWTSSGNAVEFLKLRDPANNLACQVHLYCDPNAGGGTTEIVSETIIVDRLRNVVEWGRKNGVQVLVAEIGLAASNPLAAKCWQNGVDFMNANRDVVLGFMFWALGPEAWWKGYRFTLCKQNGVDSPQMKLIQGSFK